jgi:hypothetical protein
MLYKVHFIKKFKTTRGYHVEFLIEQNLNIYNKSLKIIRQVYEFSFILFTGFEFLLSIFYIQFFSGGAGRFT